MEDNNQNEQNLNPSPTVSPAIQTPSIQTPPVSNPSNPLWQGLSLLKIVIAVILFLLITGSAAGFYIFKQQSSKIAVKPTPSPVVQKQTPTPTPDPTADWKTYANPLIDFTFKYPQDFDAKLNQIDSNNQTITISSPTNSSDQMHTTLFVTKNIQNLTWDKYLQNTYGQPTHPGGNPSFTVEGIMKDFKSTNIPIPNSFSFKGNMMKGDLPRTLFFYKNDFYTFVLYGGTGEGAGYSPEAEKIYDQILSTFKFTPASSSGGDSNATPTPTCMPRPACLDATPRCMIAEPANGWCLKT